MANKINRGTRGWLDLFLGKVGGQGPQRFSDEVRPVVEVDKFLNPDLLRTAVATASGLAGTAAEITVPTEEAWQIYQVSCAVQDSFSTIGSSVGECRLSSIPGDASGYATLMWAHVAIQVTPSGGVRVDDSNTWTPNGKIILPPGAKLAMSITQTTSSCSVQISCVYARLRT